MQLPFKLSLFNRCFPRLWWVIIRTEIPKCLYYFGPFETQKEAQLSQSGYLEDLLAEKALGITVEIQQARPKTLTIFEEDST